MLKLPKDRKANERLQRDELILSVAQQLLIEKGLQGLSMQGIANNTQYSKGTIYQHYRGKEDVVAKLVIRCGERLIKMIDLALEQGNSIRHKIVLVSAAFFVNAQVQPETAILVAKVKSEDFQIKLSQEHQLELKALDDEVLRRVIALFSQGTEFNDEKVRDAAFGWWAMKWGVHDVLSNTWDMSRLGFSDPIAFFFRSLCIYLDGLEVPKDDTDFEWSKIKLEVQILFKDFK